MTNDVQLNFDWVYFNFSNRSEKKGRRSCKNVRTGERKIGIEQLSSLSHQYIAVKCYFCHRTDDIAELKQSEFD